MQDGSMTFHRFEIFSKYLEIKDRNAHVLCARKSVIEQRGEKKLKTINFCSTNVSIPNRSRSQIDCTYTTIPAAYYYRAACTSIHSFARL